MEKDAYKTISKPGNEALYKEKGSKFFAYSFPVQSETEVEAALDELKTKHHKASHFCYAWQIGQNYEHFRVNDDGEPGNSAGMPIYGQLQAYDVTNILVVVVRYFGGTKLGVGGLISAYKISAQMALDESKILSKTINLEFEVHCEYDKMNLVMRMVKEYDLNLVHQDLALDCNFKISVRQKDFQSIFEKFKAIYGLEVSSEFAQDEEE
ncbi:IMPACT family protein [Psychroflexus aestuariivivens]|uniref:IMPACT family protein n=1 Tax=Psychroflexus aestuariivivens TaxID=1795040 RepID=UPI000FDCC26C|nr:YigZ family protein [Psychroflexus aestuariivivens]